MRVTLNLDAYRHFRQSCIPFKNNRNIMTLEKILSIPKSFWVSLHFFSFKDAIRLPVLVRYNAKIQSLKGTVRLASGG